MAVDKCLKIWYSAPVGGTPVPFLLWRHDAVPDLTNAVRIRHSRGTGGLSSRAFLRMHALLPAYYLRMHALLPAYFFLDAHSLPSRLFPIAHFPFSRLFLQTHSPPEKHTNPGLMCLCGAHTPNRSWISSDVTTPELSWHISSGFMCACFLTNKAPARRSGAVLNRNARRAGFLI